MKRTDLLLCAGAMADYRQGSGGSVRMRWKRGSCVLQYSTDPCCKGARSSGVNYSQWQQERIRFTGAAGIGGECTKESKYEHESFSKWTLHSGDSLSLSFSVEHALKVSTGDCMRDCIYAQIAFACVCGWSEMCRTQKEIFLRMFFFYYFVHEIKATVD